MNINDKTIINEAEIISKALFANGLNDIAPNQLHTAVSRSIIAQIAEMWKISREKQKKTRCAYYFSAEYLVGRAIFNNLLCLGLTDKIDALLGEKGLSLKDLESCEDAALGNGGLGRLAACFLDSAATLNLPLMGYGIRYKYGLFKQEIEDGEQVEKIDDWTRGGDPWSIRRDDLAVTVDFGDQSVTAVAYDMPILGYGTDNIGTLRLWQAEPTEPFDFMLFNEQEYDKALNDKNNAENISRVLYPNDTKKEGKMLRLKQQYFFTSASLQDIIRRTIFAHGSINEIEKHATIQLNDTHPVLAIPEFIRIMTEMGVTFDKALKMAKSIFNYTNHTVMQEALEKWDMALIEETLPQIAPIIEKIDVAMKEELSERKIYSEIIDKLSIIKDDTVYMANLAVYASSAVNGVAAIHTEILKNELLSDWHKIYPNKIRNKTNGITQRRWLRLCNDELSTLITGLLSSDKWITDTSELSHLHDFENDSAVIDSFMKIKKKKREQLAEYLFEKCGIKIDPNTVFDIQIKRLHEYKRQLLNALVLLAIYYDIKDGAITDFEPTTFIFASKAAPGYRRAKGIIKFINEIAKMIENDKEVSKYMKIVFLPNYNVTYAEKLVAAADVSVQISTAGTEASGTGNMKMMMNGAVTLGTLDGANIEIVNEAGEENNYIFGMTVKTLDEIKDEYEPQNLYKNNAKINRVLNTLIDGTFDDGKSGVFKEIFDSLLTDSEYEKADKYYLLLDFTTFYEARMKLNRDTKNRTEFAKKGLKTLDSSGKFTSDRTISEYASDIWKISEI
ncbi:MAG: glycogen/starch/alpha-glucan family phosphorylase [Clostridia bacterium]|nr:glycogen/starch/alpha-glucan family phosphorylase [Clostridia bacterium]